MIKEFIALIVDIFKAIFRFKDKVNQQNQQSLQQQQQQLQNQYNKIDEQHQVKPDQALQEIEDKLNDRFNN